MNFKRLKHLFVLIALLCFVNQSSAQVDKEHVEAAMRLLGHQILLNSGDSSSLVLPIESEGEKYRIRFESGFSFVPSEFVRSIDSIVRATSLAKSYRVEVENSDNRKIVYSYEVDSSQSIIIPCGTRNQPKARYSLLVTLLDESNPKSALQKEVPNQTSSNSGMLIAFVVSIFVLFGVGVYFWKRRAVKKENSDGIKIGKYRFDQRNMKLRIKNVTIDLTSKEADLLALLHSSLNETLERDVILRAVWEDEGDYVGRTLDVFISKLRKKFVEDSTVKIVNVRGVGYKLMLDVNNT